MTFDELLGLIDSEPRAGWHMNYGGRIRDKFDSCPVCHVANNIFLGNFRSSDVKDAAAKLGLSNFGLYLEKIVTATDLSEDKLKDRLVHDELRAEYFDMRRKLLKATGLKEQEL